MTKLKLTTLLIAAALMLLFGQCKRNHVEINPQIGAISESVVNGNDAVKRIVKFKDMLSYYKSNPNAKDGNTMSLADAICDLENTFNATYSYSEDMYSESMDHEFILNLNVDSDGNVLLTDLAALYEQIVSSARNAYANDGFENKIFISLLADVIGINNNVAVIKIKAKTGERTNYIPLMPHLEGPFGSGDDYKYDYGTCDNPDVGYGAAYYIQQALRELIVNDIVEPEDGYRSIYINRYEIVFEGGPDSYRGLFYRTNIHDVCITSDFMNDYWHAEKRAIFVTIPGGSTFTGGQVLGITIEPVTTQDYITHRTSVLYADRLEADINDIGEVEDLLRQ